MTSRRPAYIQRWLDANLHRFDLPEQMLGDEPNARQKPWDSASVRWCLVASWPYEQAAGNSSIPVVYSSVNDAREDFLCDRFYLPSTPRDLKLLEKNNIPVFGIETKHQLADFDIVGTSISYPVLSMSFTKMLTMSDIPLRWRDRDPNKHPMIMAGGLSYAAPEMLAPVVDCWWLGEVEDEPGNPGIGEVTARIAQFRMDDRWSHDRVGCYEELAREFRFLYFPRHVDFHYGYDDRTVLGVGPHASKQVIAYTSNVVGLRLPYLKRHVKDLDAIAPLSNPPLLYSDPAMGSGDLEVARGCPAWCTFCALTFRQKPYRQRTVDYVVDYAGEFARNMGSVRMAPFSPDFPMHTQRKALIAALLEKVSDEVDAPTMRVDDFIADDQFILLQVQGGMDSVTLGVEGNSQRMRDLVGKGTADVEIHEAVTRGIRAGIKKFKLFMITNLPGETEGDVFRILKLGRELADIRDQLGQPNVRIQFSWTPLLIEAQTPMQWFAPTSQTRILGDIWDRFRDLKIDFKLGAKGEPNKMAFFQLSQRASRDVGEALVDAIEDVDQACWGGVPRHFQALIEEKLRARGFHNGYLDCFDERELHDMFGWEHIDQGISTTLLWKTYVHMREFLAYTDANTYDGLLPDAYHGAEWVNRCDIACQGKKCGACDHADLKLRKRYIDAAHRERHLALPALRPVDQRTQAIRVRARIDTAERYRFVDNAHWRFAVRRAAFRAQHELHWKHGIAKRTIRFASDTAGARDWTHGTDYVEFALTRHAPASDLQALLDAMNAHLQPWLHITDWNLHPATAKTLRADTGATLFDLDINDDPATALARLDWWNATADIPLRIRTDAGYFAPATEEVNARRYVDDLWLRRDGTRLKLRVLLHGRPSPYHIHAALTGRASWLDAAKHPARRVETFTPGDRHQQDFLRPNCDTCGLQIPTTILDRPYHPTFCPRCLDAHEGLILQGS